MGTSIQRHLQQQRPFRSLEQEVFVGVQLAADRLMLPWAQYLREHARLTPVQYNVLRILRGAEPDGLGVGEVARRMITRSPDVTRLLDRLEQQRLVRRTADAADRRAVRVRITRAGRERIAALDGAVDTLLEQALGGLERRELKQLRDTLGQILDAIEPLA